MIFGKFVSYKTCDVSCLIDIDDGNDVGMTLVKDVSNKSVEEISNFLKEEAKTIKPKGGDIVHKKRMSLLHILPSYLIAVLLDVVWFLSSHLSINIPSLGLNRDSLGAMIVTPVGTQGYRDAYAPFFGSTGQWMIMTVNAAHKEAVVEEGNQIKVATIVNVNCVIDHRYLYSGKKGKKVL